ncbi:MAG: hypothetical protein IPM46_07920 [Flavobacteriales bacterium]|nr:hypothetical protein [Flavobacteriales bacterium]
MTAIAFALLMLALAAVFTCIVRITTQVSWPLALCAGTLIVLATIGVCLPVSLFLGLPQTGFIGLLVVIGSAAFRYAYVNRRFMGRIRLAWRSPDWLDAAFAFTVLCFTWLFTGQSFRWGGWDAWAQWNMHARFLVGDSDWRALLRTTFAHPDYPLMQPSIIASCWRVVGQVEPLSPMLLSALIAVLLLGTVYASMREQVARPFTLAAFVLLGLDSGFAGQVASQYADSLLGLCMLLATVFLCHSDRPTASELMLAGFFSGCAAWTKNEGLAFVAVMTVIAGWTLRARWPALRFFLLGTLPLLVPVVWFKLAYAPVSDLAGGVASLWPSLTSWHRHWSILSTGLDVVLRELPLFLPLLLLTLVVGGRGRLNRGLVALLLMLMAYYITYLLTPYNLAWHLTHSFNRLLHQLLPMLIFIAFTSAFSPNRLRRWQGFLSQ